MPAARLPQVGIVIPARYASSRFPGKPLVRLRGATGVGRSLIERSWRAALEVPGVETIWVATDDCRIAEEVKRFGGRVVMTPTDCANGTERCAAALAGRADVPDIIVNLQGDAPLTPPAVVAAVVARLVVEPDLTIATPAVRCTPSIYRHLTDDQAAGRVGGTTMVFNAAGDALYFSKRVIPYVPSDYPLRSPLPVYLHMGIYGYRPEALARYAAAAPSLLEQVEGLEQLRFLDLGMRVGAVICEPPDWDIIELNNPTDVAPIEAMLQRRGLD